MIFLSLCACLLVSFLVLLAGAYASSCLFGVDGGLYSHGKTARPFGMPRKEYAKCAFFQLNALCPKSEADAPNDFEAEVFLAQSGHEVPANHWRCELETKRERKEIKRES